VIRKGNIFLTITEFEQNLPIYLNRIGKWRHQTPLKREQGFMDFQWVQCTGGQGMLLVNGTKQPIGQGQGMLLYPNEPHEYYPIESPWEIHWATFNGACATSMLHSLNLSSSQVLTFANPDPLMQKIYQIFSTGETSDPMRGLKCSTLFYELLVDIYRYGTHAEVRSKQQYFELLTPALRYIEDHYFEQITLENLASKLCVTPQYTCSLFQNTLGIRPFEYITKIRLRKAKELLLRQHELNINEIARKVGYENVSYFNKVFMRDEGTTPKQFRRNSSSSD
jgi:AraC family transcriptional regulator of arabinose operon